MKTDRDVITQAMKTLRLTVSGQAPDLPEYQDVEEVFQGVFAELQANEIIAWGGDETPAEAFYALAEYVAQRARHHAPDDVVRQELAAMGAGPYLRLVAVCASRWNGAPIYRERV